MILLTHKQILEKLAEIDECSVEEVTMGFCHNGRRWTFMMMLSQRPETCTYPNAFKGCDGCGYYERRKPTRYILDKMKYLGWGMEN